MITIRSISFRFRSLTYCACLSFQFSLRSEVTIYAHSLFAFSVFSFTDSNNLRFSSSKFTNSVSIKLIISVWDMFNWSLSPKSAHNRKRSINFLATTELKQLYLAQQNKQHNDTAYFPDQNDHMILEIMDINGIRNTYILPEDYLNDEKTPNVLARFDGCWQRLISIIAKDLEWNRNIHKLVIKHPDNRHSELRCDRQLKAAIILLNNSESSRYTKLTIDMVLHKPEYVWLLCLCSLTIITIKQY